MEGYQENMQNLSDYLVLIRELFERRKDTDGPPDEIMRERFSCELMKILEREAATSQDVTLTAPLLREAFHLDFAAFFLVMTAFAFEIDGGLRMDYRSRLGRESPCLHDGFLLLELMQPLDSWIYSVALVDSMLTLCLLRSEKEQGYIMERPLVLTQTVVGFLTCGSLTGHTWRIYPAGSETLLPLNQEPCGRFTAFLAQKHTKLALVRGKAGTGRRSLVKEAVNRLGTIAVFVELSKLSVLHTGDFENRLREVAAAAILGNAVVCLTGAKPELVPTLNLALERLEHFSLSAVVLSEDRLPGLRETDGLWAEFQLPSFLEDGESRIAWEGFSAAAGEYGYSPEAMAVRYRYCPGKVRRLTESAAMRASFAGRKTQDADIAAAVREETAAYEFAITWEAEVSIENLILPEGTLRQLTRLCAMVKNRKVLGENGVGSVGVTALFHGESGTGKTMAASAAARELGMPLLRADLAAVVDKYIGETEKHLDRLFDCALDNNCVLFFDEADALFGKRTSVESSHDKYSNISTSYLLQRLERHEGVVLLATNILHNFDEAFLRRIQYILKFPMPDAALREELWKSALSKREWAAQNVDCALLAQAELSPARICEAVRSARVMTLCDKAAVTDMGQVVSAVRLELEKGGKLLPSCLQRFTAE